MRTIRLRLSDEDYERLVEASALVDRAEVSVAVQGINLHVLDLLASVPE